MSQPRLPRDAIEKVDFKLKYGLRGDIYETHFAPRLRAWAVGRSTYVSEAEGRALLAQLATFTPPTAPAESA